MKQTTNAVFMIRPISFRMNEETAGNNHYQQQLGGIDAHTVIHRAQEEFEGLVTALQNAGVNVIVFDEAEPHETPDALFPNNWISTHEDGTVGLYPMFADNRRRERRDDVLLVLEHECGFQLEEVVDFTEFESHGKFLEGTGSMVLDRVNRKAYAALSERTDARALAHFCDQFGYEPIAFIANQTVGSDRLPIYHTNVMMSIGSGFAAVCLDAVDNVEERAKLEASLTSDGLEIIELSEAQIGQFAGNMLQLEGDGKALIVMSQQAKNSLSQQQIDRLSTYGQLIDAPLNTIETLGGGSARCMIAEIHLPKL